MINFRASKPSESTAIEDLFVSVFTRAEGLKEGALVGKLARQLMTETDSRDLHGFVAEDDGRVVGAIFFSRLGFASEPDVFILSPVAIDTGHQGKGLGQALINHGLDAMREAGVRFVITYGDPAFYGKVGFDPISPDAIAPPHPLSQPEGWLGQSLGDAKIDKIPGRCCCVAALDDPSYW